MPQSIDPFRSLSLSLSLTVVPVTAIIPEINIRIRRSGYAADLVGGWSRNSEREAAGIPVAGRREEMSSATLDGSGLRKAGEDVLGGSDKVYKAMPCP